MLIPYTPAGYRVKCPGEGGTDEVVPLATSQFKLNAGMLYRSAFKFACKHNSPGTWRSGIALGLMLAGAAVAAAGVVSVRDEGQGNDYISGDPITLPGARLSTNRFGNGVQCVINRPHCVKPAAFDASGRILFDPNGGAKPTFGDSQFPAYLEGQEFVWFLQDVRHYTNYACTVTVDCPSTFYLLVDNRVNEFGADKSYTDPVFGPPDTEWIPADGWKRVNTGLTPVITPVNQGDYVGIDEGCNGTLNQLYAVYRKTLREPGSVTLRTQFEGNIYCLVVSTNLPVSSGLTQPRFPSIRPNASQ